MNEPDPEILRQVEAIPRAIEPAFPLSLDSNASVLLWNGAVDISQNGVTEQGTAEVRWVWLPGPRIEVTCSIAGHSQIQVGRGVHVLSPGSFVDSDGLIFNKSFDGANTILSGSLKHVGYGRNQELQSVTFHLPNFFSYLGDGVRGDITVDGDEVRCQNWFGRLVLADDEWRITIDALDGTLSSPTFFQTLRRVRGNGFTHVGRVERIDGDPFRPFQAERVLEALNVWFTFCRGLNCYPLLPVGVDAAGNRAWESWRAMKVDPCASFDSWFPWGTYRDYSALGSAFREFRSLWADETWREAMKIIAEWYAETNHTVTLDTAIVHNQVGLELLAWVIVVEQNNTINATAFADHLKAYERIRLLNVWTGVDPAIPPELKHLSGIAGQRNWEDGPKAITELRNGVVHPNLRHRALTAPPDVRREARDLGVWYFDLFILRLLNYRGRYWKRIPGATNPNGLVSPPWVV